MKTNTVTVGIEFPKCRRGAACKWAWNTNNVVVTLTACGQTARVARSGKLISWRSGNFSSQAKMEVAAHMRLFDRLLAEFSALPPVSALIRARSLALEHRSPGFRAFERAVSAEIESTM